MFNSMPYEFKIITIMGDTMIIKYYVVHTNIYFWNWRRTF